MSSDDNVDLGVQHRGEGVPKCPPSAMNSGPLSEKVAGVTMNSMPMFRTSSGSDPFFSSGWDPLASLHHSANFGGSSTMTSEFPSSSYPLTLENQGVGPVSHMNQYSSSSGLVDMVPKLPCYGSGNFSDMVASFGLSECGQVPNIGCLPSYSPNDDAVTARAFSNGAQSQDDCQLADDTALGASFSGRRRKRGLDFPSPLNPNKSLEVEQQKELLGERSELQEQLSDKKQKAEQETGTNNSGKQLGKQSKDNSSNGDAPKDNYVHVRAKRGQATNSHSLAERVRREKISERMKMLQELVPGCNKITGKAVMLDEIINYVQSLQQQVEFLSMKLATVNPELNIDIERLLSKDVLHSRGSNAAILGFGHGMNSPHPYPHGISPGSLTGIPSTGNLHPMPQLQAMWDNDLHNVFQTGYNSNPNDNIGPSGRPKSEV